MCKVSNVKLDRKTVLDRIKVVSTVNLEMKNLYDKLKKHNVMVFF